jgi:uncharacterized protein (DUF4415 family)
MTKPFGHGDYPRGQSADARPGDSRLAPGRGGLPSGSSRPRRKKSRAERARELAAKGLEPPAIAEKLDVSPQAVRAAIKRGGQRGAGRPKREGTERVTIRLSEAVLTRARAGAEAEGVTLGDWIEAVIAAQLMRSS